MSVFAEQSKILELGLNKQKSQVKNQSEEKKNISH